MCECHVKHNVGPARLHESETNNRIVVTIKTDLISLLIKYMNINYISRD